MIDNAIADDGFAMLAHKITRETAFRCASYKDECLRRRIAVRMRARGTESFESYARLLDTDRREYERLLDALTVNVTKFFRNPSTYEVLAHTVVPELWSRGGSIDVWSAGTASGEEAFSLAALFHDHAVAQGELRATGRVSVLGSDIDAASLRAAEHARYAPASFAETSPDALVRLFPSVEGARTVIPEVRALVRFERRDLLRDPVRSRAFDLVACRNVAIYLGRDAQAELLASLHAALRPGGYLVLGKAERLVGDVQHAFEPVNVHERIYRRTI